MSQIDPDDREQTDPNDREQPGGENGHAPHPPGMRELQEGYDAGGGEEPLRIAIPLGGPAPNAAGDARAANGGAADAGAAGQGDPPPDARGEQQAEEPDPANGGGVGEEEQNPRAGATAHTVGKQSLQEQVAVADDDVLKHCLAASRDGRFDMITFLGQTGTGKSFLIKRLAKVLSNQYDCLRLNGDTVSWNESEMNETVPILAFHFRPKNSDSQGRHLLIWDLPGERYLDLHAKLFPGSTNYVFKADSASRLPATCAILALTNAIGFVMPAMRVLHPDLYIANGDSTTADADMRRDQVMATRLLIESLSRFRDVVTPLRVTADRHWHDAARLRADIDAWIATTPRAARVTRRLDIPALVLLTRAEDYRKSLGGGAGDEWDRQPLLRLLQAKENLVGEFGRQFNQCTWDFITAYEDCQPFTPDDDLPHYGVSDLYHHWLLDAMKRARRPVWQRLFGASDHEGLLALAQQHGDLRRWLEA